MAAGRRTLLLAVVCACVFALPSSASVGWYAKWNCNAPCVVTVDYSAMPASEQPVIQAAMDRWANPNISFRAATNGAKVKVVPCVANSVVKGRTCGFITYPQYTKNTNTLHSATIEISDQWFGWDGMPLVYCHELGHTLGFMDGAVEPDSCMAGTSDHPGVEDYALLALLYA